MEKFFPYTDIPPREAVHIIDLFGQCLEDPNLIRPIINVLNDFEHNDYNNYYKKMFSKRYWYNNGNYNIRLSKYEIENEEVPDGFYKGRDFKLPTKEMYQINEGSNSYI